MRADRIEDVAGGVVLARQAEGDADLAVEVAAAEGDVVAVFTAGSRARGRPAATSDPGMLNPARLAALVILAPVVALSASCIADAPASDGVGELEALSAAQAAERVGISADDVSTLNTCERECLSFATLGCAEITQQCEDDYVAVAGYYDGPYRLDCDTAKRLACGTVADLHTCMHDRRGWLGRILNKLGSDASAFRGSPRRTRERSPAGSASS
jgi:hypothetical protein